MCQSLVWVSDFNRKPLYYCYHTIFLQVWAEKDLFLEKFSARIKPVVGKRVTPYWK